MYISYVVSPQHTQNPFLFFALYAWVGRAWPLFEYLMSWNRSWNVSLSCKTLLLLIWCTPIEGAITHRPPQHTNRPIPQEGLRNALKQFTQGNDLFVNLPTGFGKSVIFQAAPVIIDFLKKDVVVGEFGNAETDTGGGEKALVIVVLPLKALAVDQLIFFRPRASVYYIIHVHVHVQSRRYTHTRAFDYDEFGLIIFVNPTLNLN